jgi:hypothetical protein
VSSIFCADVLTAEKRKTRQAKPKPTDLATGDLECDTRASVYFGRKGFSPRRDKRETAKYNLLEYLESVLLIHPCDHCVNAYVEIFNAQGIQAQL